MREPPVGMSEAALVAALRSSHGVAATSIDFLPLGHDSTAAVFRVSTAEWATYFLKARRGDPREPGPAIAGWLSARGIDDVPAPLSTRDGQHWGRLDGLTYTLHPFVAGRTGMEQGLTADQWERFGAIVRRLHRLPVTAELRALLPVESYVPRWGGVSREWADLRRLDARISALDAVDALTRDTAWFWRAQAERIRALVGRAEDLAGRMRRTDRPLVLCHADLHTGNVLVDSDGRLWIVDWDEAALAPRERDLMFVVGGGISRSLVTPDDERLFLRGYGPSEADPVALAYYRHAWAVQDIGDYAEQVFRTDLGAVTREAAARCLRSLFEPGEIVPLAESS